MNNTENLKIIEKLVNKFKNKEGTIDDIKNNIQLIDNNEWVYLYDRLLGESIVSWFDDKLIGSEDIYKITVYFLSLNSIRKKILSSLLNYNGHFYYIIKKLNNEHIISLEEFFDEGIWYNRYINFFNKDFFDIFINGIEFDDWFNKMIYNKLSFYNNKFIIYLLRNKKNHPFLFKIKKKNLRTNLIIEKFSKRILFLL